MSIKQETSYEKYHEHIYSKEKKRIKSKIQKLHETPSSVISAILQEYDITLTVILSMMSTYNQCTKNQI